MSLIVQSSIILMMPEPSDADETHGGRKDEYSPEAECSSAGGVELVE